MGSGTWGNWTFNFNCKSSAVDCSVTKYTTGYEVDDGNCDSNISYAAGMGYVVDFCYRTLTGTSWKFACDSDGVKQYSYTDKQCSSDSLDTVVAMNTTTTCSGNTKVEFDAVVSLLMITIVRLYQL